MVDAVAAGARDPPLQADDLGDEPIDLSPDNASKNE
jgi:hypothetical protein